MSYKCMRCGHDLIILGNFMLSDVDEELSDKDDAMITNMECPYCGARYEVTDTPISEMNKYQYFNNTKDF